MAKYSDDDNQLSLQHTGSPPTHGDPSNTRGVLQYTRRLSLYEQGCRIRGRFQCTRRDSSIRGRLQYMGGTPIHGEGSNILEMYCSKAALETAMSGPVYKPSTLTRPRTPCRIHSGLC